MMIASPSITLAATSSSWTRYRSDPRTIGFPSSPCDSSVRPASGGRLYRTGLAPGAVRLRRHAGVAELHLDTGRQACAQKGRVPVREPDAPGRRFVADRRRLRRAMNTVMRLRELDPDAADGVVGPGRDERAGLRPVDAAQEPRLVV